MIEVGPLSVRAEVRSFDPKTRTVEVIFSTGSAVERFDWFTGKRYIEKLAITPKAIRLERLNAGAPVLDSHSAYSVSDQLGAVVRDSARIEKGLAIAKLAFSRRASIADTVQDIEDGIIRSVSVGYRVHKFEEEVGQDGSIPVRTATDWEPYEISMVPMPADAGAHVRADDQKAQLNSCVVTTRQQENTMAEEQTPTTPPAGTTEPGTPAEYIRAQDPPAAPRIALAPEEPNELDQAALRERTRANMIMDACRAAKMPLKFARELIDAGIPTLEAQTRIFAAMGQQQDPAPGVPNGQARGVDVFPGEDPYVHKRAGIECALLNRVAPQHFKLTDEAREYRGMTMLDVAKAYLQARGTRVTGMSKMEIAGVALGLTGHRGSGYASTSDFPLLLADVANKSLRAEYEAAPQTFSPITRNVSLTDFKAANRIQIGDAPALAPVNEHGEFTRGTIAEGREQIQLATYGRVFAITRRALVNDDTDAFSRVPAKFGRAARNLESDLVWYQIMSNPTMGDSVALFHATHANYAGAGSISIANISAGEKAMMIQTGIDGTTLIMSQPKYLIVPPSQKTRALQFVSTNMQAALATNINVFAGQLTVIAEPRLEVGVTIGTVTQAGSSTAWYLASSPDQVDILELAMLEGQSGPLVESRIGFDVDGLEIKCRHDVGAKIIDHRGLYKSDGSIES